MPTEVSERSLEDAIEAALTGNTGAGDEMAEARTAYGFAAPGGYRSHSGESYDRALSLLPGDLVDFVVATQPKEWNRLKEHHGDAVRERFARRVSAEVARRGTLDVLRRGVKDSGCRFELAYF
ncbi:MAG: hypothetical protein R3190_18540, partial [Thermoanaerobaculia bacterium]|nr:hypothetical protein [Thermoanaerobaculia bacterium]